VPPKIRELKKLLHDAGFTERKGKGSHTNWKHPAVADKVTVVGKNGADAQKYQERQVEAAILLSKVKP
jgi:predicted RNA binding protein YcfA (HicA-like mRNA interferase family)